MGDFVHTAMAGNRPQGGLLLRHIANGLAQFSNPSAASDQITKSRIFNQCHLHLRIRIIRQQHGDRACKSGGFDEFHRTPFYTPLAYSFYLKPIAHRVGSHKDNKAIAWVGVCRSPPLWAIPRIPQGKPIAHGVGLCKKNFR